MPASLQTLILLTLSNVFMTFAEGELPLISRSRWLEKVMAARRDAPARAVPCQAP